MMPLPVAFTKKRFVLETVFVVSQPVPVAFAKASPPRVEMPVTSSLPDSVAFVPEAFVKASAVAVPEAVVNWVEEARPEGSTSKKTVAAVLEVRVRRLAVWPARPRMFTVELPTFEDWTVNLDVDVAPMPTESVEVVRERYGLLRTQFETRR
jgi:hypothetical protein